MILYAYHINSDSLISAFKKLHVCFLIKNISSPKSSYRSLTENVRLPFQTSWTDTDRTDFFFFKDISNKQFFPLFFLRPLCSQLFGCHRPGWAVVWETPAMKNGHRRSVLTNMTTEDVQKAKEHDDEFYFCVH